MFEGHFQGTLGNTYSLSSNVGAGSGLKKAINIQTLSLFPYQVLFRHPYITECYFCIMGPDTKFTVYFISLDTGSIAVNNNYTVSSGF